MNPKTVLQSIATNVARTVTDLPGNYRQTYSDFRALERALFADDLAVAREAYIRIQTDSPSISAALSRNPFPVDNRRLRAFKKLGHCLMVGDLNGARQAATKFQYAAS